MHCPQDVFDIVTQNAAATAEKRAQTVATKDNRDSRQNLQLLREIFPRMPAKTMEEILAHGFQKGSGRVGRATRLNEEKRIELAVNAHIRHRFTDYEIYLRARRNNGNGSPSPRTEARQRVIGKVTKIANSWRPDAQNAGIEPCQHPMQAAVCPVKVTRGLGASAKQSAKKAAMAGGVYFESHPRDKLKPGLESLSRQPLEIPRPQERTPRTLALTDVSDSEMERREENGDSRAKDDLSSEHESTDMSDESELEDAEEIGEGKAEDASAVEVVLSTESGRSELRSYMAKEVPLDTDFDRMDCS